MLKSYTPIQAVRLKLDETWHFFWEGRAKVVRSIIHRFKHCTREIQYLDNGYKITWKHYPQKGYKEFIASKLADDLVGEA